MRGSGTLLGLLCLGVVSVSRSAQAQPPPAPVSLSFDGQIDGTAIWMELKVPAADGPVTGSYFYVKHGKPIQLSGTREDSTVTLQETYRNKVTGILKFQLSAVSELTADWKVAKLDMLTLHGTWNKPGKSDTKSASAAQSNPAYKACIRLNPGELELTSGGSFAGEMERYSGEDFQDPSGDDEDVTGSDYVIMNCGKGFFSVDFTWKFYANARADPSVFSVRHTFDLATKKEVDLWSELDPDKSKQFSSYLARVLHPKLSRAQRKVLTANKNQSEYREQFHLEDGSLMVGWPGDFEWDLPNGEMGPADTYVSVPFSELRKYLKQNSVLNKLAPSAARP